MANEFPLRDKTTPKLLNLVTFKKKMIQRFNKMLTLCTIWIINFTNYIKPMVCWKNAMNDPILQPSKPVVNCCFPWQNINMMTFLYIKIVVIYHCVLAYWGSNVLD